MKQRKTKKTYFLPQGPIQAPVNNYHQYRQPQEHFQPHNFQTQFRLISPRPGTDKTPMVLVASEAYADMLYLCHLSDFDEIGWLGHVRELEDRHYLIDEIFIVDQEVTGSSCEMTEAGLEGLAMELIDQGQEDKNNGILFWGHLHPSGSTAPSAEDDKQMSDTFGHTNFFIRGIFGRTGRVELTFYDYLNGIRWNDIPWRIYTELSQERKDFLAEQVKAKVKEGRAQIVYYQRPTQHFNQALEVWGIGAEEAIY